MTLFLKLFFALLIGHAILDFALQTEFMAVTKSRHRPPAYLGKSHLPMWPYTLTYHALVNAGAVYTLLIAFI